jgi:uncharacterized protein
MSHLHQTHPALVKRLKRAHGHLGNVVAMMTEGRSCGELAQQLHAVEKAVAAAKKALIHDHLDHCLDDAMKSRRAGSERMMSEFRDITKYL